jgi:cell division protein FtsI (penicillin-binding protein 3)
MLLLAFLLTAFLSVIASRLYTLQIAQHQEITARATQQYERRIPLATKRGTLYDRQGRELAVTVETSSVFAHPNLIQDPKGTASQLSHALHVSSAEIVERLRSGRPFVWIQRKVERGQAEKVAALKLPGVGLVPEGKRYYPKRELAAHLMGFVGIDDKGLEGIELQYDHLLSDGSRLLTSQVDALGRIVSRKEEKTESVSDLYLTIDEAIQHVAERELEKVVRRSEAKGGTVVVMDPKTGEILALANLPTYSPNDYANYPPALRRNRALTDPYEPGSAFKAILAAAALEEGVVKPADLFHGEDGVIEVAGVKIRDHEKYGWMTFRDVLAYSSNVGTIKVGLKVGKGLLYSYITNFGFGLPTGIDLPGESPGLIRRPRSWSQISISALSIGQEISVTPLQLITAFAAVANGGSLIRPYVVKAVRGPDQTLRQVAPFPVRKVISRETAKTLTSILQDVVGRGTGQEAAVPGYTVAGKTGTAQKTDNETGRYSHNKLVASFVGYVPAEEPRLVILVLVDEPRRFAWGGTGAAPAFREIAREALAYLKIPRAPKEVQVARRPYEAPATTY